MKLVKANFHPAWDTWDIVCHATTHQVLFDVRDEVEKPISRIHYDQVIRYIANALYNEIS